jgi:hypothetical protein
MTQIDIEIIRMTLIRENDGVRVKSGTEDVILPNQTIDQVARIIHNNFYVIKTYYESKIPGHLKDRYDLQDIDHITISILLHYLYMYNAWRKMYKKHANKELRFDRKDLDNPSTHDIVFSYFRMKYPNEWREKCSVLLGMSVADLSAYYKTREAFYNR